MVHLEAGRNKGETGRHLPLSLSALVLQSRLSGGACWFFVIPYVVLIVAPFLVLVLSWSCLFFALSALLLSSSSCLSLGLFFSISSGLVVLCLLSCLCLVLSCLALVSVLVLSYLCCVGLSVVLRCVFVVLGRFVDSFFVSLGRLGGRCWPFWVVLGRSWARFGGSFGPLGRS